MQFEIAPCILPPTENLISRKSQNGYPEIRNSRIPDIQVSGILDFRISGIPIFLWTWLEKVARRTSFRCWPPVHQVHWSTSFSTGRRQTRTVVSCLFLWAVRKPALSLANATCSPSCSCRWAGSAAPSLRASAPAPPPPPRGRWAWCRPCKPQTGRQGARGAGPAKQKTWKIIVEPF